MSRFVLYFICVLSSALALVPSAAHVMELPNKIKMPKQSTWWHGNSTEGGSLLG